MIIACLFPWEAIICICLTADAENEESNSESITGKEAIDLKELKRVDHILATLQRKVIFFLLWIT